MRTLFSSESVSEGHPDKIADQIADAILDEFLRLDPESKVACEVFVTTGLVIIGGEVTSNAWVDIRDIARKVIADIGYTRAEYKFDSESCGIISLIESQSPDIYQGVVREKPDEQGAGDQGMMFGYACTETEELMPLPIVLAHITLMELAAIRKEGKQMTYLRPDSKCQFTIEYDEKQKAQRIDTLVLSTQHDPFAEEHLMHRQITEDVLNILLPRVIDKVHPSRKHLFEHDLKLLVNPTGKFVIGGPHGDTGLTGRKIIVDTYGGRGAHGGGAFSGKDPSKVDRSACYAARHIAKNLVAAGAAEEVLVQLAYAIGVAQPVSVFVNTFGTAHTKKSDAEIAQIIAKVYDLRPARIIEELRLKYPIYKATAAYGHFGRDPFSKNGIDYFSWEKLNYAEVFKSRLF
ncbi:MAG TPA: methionine adenosyltransferase [Bacteroidales bacterium]|jgi:S-adenosylmethionine synthetase|nr:methionine adenosyltransferase [Bacteroidales bacterium]OQC56628.1 MAG: S-adenosylmethionine synthase [Bacteroidetes bacterium ADurb.Bin013]MBP8999319.1 methionine adenosyltransferase [Bacteroidales bacterium]MBV6456391.1 S-adenosylmethionine synthase [Bacteroidales bacterium]MCZ2317613.1 methionine adenosyltransferase [Bacteroidales bacterium]